MGLLQKLKSLLGLGGGRRRQRGRDRRPGGNTDVTVEREPATGSENAVKGTDAGGQGQAAAGQAGASSAAGGSQAGQSDGGSTTEPVGGTEEPAAAGTTEEPDATAGSDDAAAGEDTAAADTADEDSPSVDVIEGIGSAYADRLAGASIETVADLAAADPEAVAEETDISEKRLRRWIDRAQDH